MRYSVKLVRAERSTKRRSDKIDSECIVWSVSYQVKFSNTYVHTLLVRKSLKSPSSRKPTACHFPMQSETLTMTSEIEWSRMACKSNHCPDCDIAWCYCKIFQRNADAPSISTPQFWWAHKWSIWQGSSKGTSHGNSVCQLSLLNQSSRLLIITFVSELGRYIDRDYGLAEWVTRTKSCVDFKFNRHTCRLRKTYNVVCEAVCGSRFTMHKEGGVHLRRFIFQRLRNLSSARQHFARIRAR